MSSTEQLTPAVLAGVPARTSGHAGLVLVILCFVYVLNFLDRQLLSILAKPIQDELQLTDGQLGRIGGLYFALFYTLIALPVGWFADRTNRVRVLTWACALWSAATVACGLARNYPQLVVARMTVGIGEAGGVPPSYAIISDYFPSGRRGTALGLYNLGPPIGMVLGVAFGASIAAAYSWRTAFVVLGAVGIGAALIVHLFVREPERGALDRPRGGEPAQAPAAKAAFWPTLRMFFARPVLVLVSVASGVTQIVTYATLNFATLFLMREKGMTLNEVAIYYALVVAVAVGPGIYFSGWLTDRVAARTKQAYALVPALGLVLAVPFFVGFVWAPTWPLALWFLIGPFFFNYYYLSAAIALVQEEVRPDQRVLSGALLLLVMNLMGLGLGPTYLGAMSDVFHAAHPDNSLQLAFYTLTPFYLLAIVLFVILSRLLRREDIQDKAMSEMRLSSVAGPLLSIVLVAAMVAGGASTAWADGAGPLVRTSVGEIRGETAGNLVVFKGIPYALPPLGEQRWKPPRPVPPWDDVRDAGTFGPVCVQPGFRQGSIFADQLPQMSEDCLNLNIWAPGNAANAPVFVWIHGGALITGANSLPLYDGSALANQGLVVVAINYRLGVLGYLAHPQLSAESPQHVSGNYGLLDQIAALEWVRRNIRSFGGDPDNVTIAGESAGGLSVMYLMASPQARGLFARAIAQSAYMISTPALRESRHGLDAAEATGERVVARLGADGIAALRAMDAEKLISDAPKAGYAPLGTIDGLVLPREIVEAFDRGEQAPVPLLAGFNSGEIRALRFLLPPPPADAAAYETEIRARYGDLADRFLKLYPPDDVPESMLAATRDAMYGWTAERLVARQSELGVPAYLYVFDHGYPAADDIGMHAFHGSELPYVFSTMDRTPPRWPKAPDDESETHLTTALRGYWASFARSGVPSVAGQPSWKPYSHERAYMRFSALPLAGSDPYPGAYALQEEVVCRRRVAGNIPWNWNIGVISPPMPPQVPQCR